MKRMDKRKRQSVIERFLLAVFVGTAIGGFAISYRTQTAWLLELPCAVSLFWRIERVPPRLRDLVRYLAWALLGGAVVLGLIFMGYPVLTQQTALQLSLLAGYSLAFFSALFLLGPGVWSPPSTLFPAALGTLVVAAFNPLAPLHGPVALAGAAVFAYLMLGTRYGLTQKLPALGHILRLAFSALGVLLVAWGIIRLLPWAQARVEQATFGFFSQQPVHYSGLSLQSRLGDLEQLKLSRRVVMRVWTSRPQKLRGRVFTQFDGQSWRARPLAGAPLFAGPPDLPFSADLNEWLDTLPGTVFVLPGLDAPLAAAPKAIRTRIVQTVFNDGLLVSPAQKLLVRAPLSSLSINAFENLSPPAGSEVEIYGIVNLRSGQVMQPGPASDEMLKECLALPEGTDGRFRDLAARLAARAASPEERVRRTVSFVESECSYSLDVGSFRSRQPVAEFLFEKKRGYCQYFASATAVLLRLQGVPARYVTGFNVQAGNWRAGHYVVREADAHAWVEAYLPDKGWVEADPTPEAEYQALHADLRSGWLAGAEEWLRAQLAELAIRLRSGDWLGTARWLWAQLKALARALVTRTFGWGLLVAVLTLVVIGVLRRWRKPRFPRVAPALRGAESAQAAPELLELLSRVDRLWARCGCARPASRAPLEHLAGIPQEKISPALRDAAGRVVECFYRSCFAHARVEPAEVRELQQALDRAGALKK